MINQIKMKVTKRKSGKRGRAGIRTRPHPDPILKFSPKPNPILKFSSKPDSFPDILRTPLPNSRPQQVNPWPNVKNENIEIY